MKAILDLLHNNEPLTAQLRAATSAESAAQLLADASKQRGQSVNVNEITTWLTQRPKTDPQALTDAELQAVSGGLMKTTFETKLTECSKICCSTCKNSYVFG